MKGIIKNYDKSKKYGFISDEYNKDYFFHISDVKSATELGKGQIVEFQPSNHVKGLRAVEIQSGKIKLTERDVIKIYYPDGIDKKIFESFSDAQKYLRDKDYVRRTQNVYAKAREIEGPLGRTYEYYHLTEILRFIESV